MRLFSAWLYVLLGEHDASAVLGLAASLGGP
jgi:hypothetical protein